MEQQARERRLRDRATARCAGSGTPSADTTRRPAPSASPRGSRSAPSAVLFSASVSSRCWGIIEREREIARGPGLPDQPVAGTRSWGRSALPWSPRRRRKSRRVTVVMYSRGSELSIVNGTRTDLPAMPKVGRSRLKSSTSGSRVRLPTGDRENRHALRSADGPPPGPAAGPRSSRRRTPERCPAGWRSFRAPWPAAR